MGMQALTNSELSQLSAFVRDHIGLSFPPEKYDDLKRGIAVISTEQGFSDPSACLSWILSLHLDQSLIEMLAASLTVGETYFFRDPHVFEVIEHTILPAIIKRRKDLGRCLRIWSAACSTGEEAYSLAILLSKIVPDINNWSITLLATDINPNALKKAEIGIYSEWSFRSTQQLWKDLYFHRLNNGTYKIKDNIRNLVTVSYLNLVEDDYPALLTNTNAMDLILCRNVLMYFSKDAILTTTEKLQRSLVPDGRLIVSMTESMLIQNHYLVPEITNEIRTYRKVDASNRGMVDSLSIIEKVSLSKEAYQPVLIPYPDIRDISPVQKMPDTELKPEIVLIPDDHEPVPFNGNEQKDYQTAVSLFASGDYGGAKKILDFVISKNPADHEAVALMAQVLANLGDLQGAHVWCMRAIALDKLSPSYHHLLATILQEEGQIDAAIEELRRALFADSSYIPAHFSLAHLKRRVGKFKESDLHFHNASVLLSRFESGEIIGGTGGMSAGTLVRNINSFIEEKGVL